MEYKVIVNSSELVCSDTKEVLGVRYLFRLVVKDLVNKYKLLHVDVCLGEENNLVINFCLVEHQFVSQKLQLEVVKTDIVTFREILCKPNTNLNTFPCRGIEHY